MSVLSLCQHDLNWNNNNSRVGLTSGWEIYGDIGVESEKAGLCRRKGPQWDITS